MHDHQNDSSDDSMKRLSSFTCGDAHDLRIVLLGVSGAGKSSMGNAILGRDVFKERTTRKVKIQIGRVEDRNISIIDTPGFFNDHLTEEELQKQMMKSLHLSDPGPHMFLLIVNLENFEKDERNVVEEIEKIFGAQALKFTMVLFIGRERMTNKEWKDFTLGEKFKGVVKNGRNQYHEINSTNEINQTHIKKLIMKIDELFKHNEYYNNKIYAVSQTSSPKERKKIEKQGKERQKEVSQETFEINTAMEEGATHEYVRQRKKTTNEETSLQERNTLALTFPSQEKLKQDKIGEMSQKNQQTTEEEQTTQAGVSAAPLAPPLPAAQQLDLNPGVATRTKDKNRGICLVLTTVCLTLICVLLLVLITLQHITIKEQSDQLNGYNNKVEEFNQIIKSLQEDFTELTTEKEMCFQFTKRLGMANSEIIKSYSLDMTVSRIFFHS